MSVATPVGQQRRETDRTVSLLLAAPAAGAVMVVALAALLAASGVGAGASIAIALLVALNAVACGVVWHIWVIRITSVTELLGIGLTGTLIVVPWATIITPVGWPSTLEWLVTPAVAAASLAVRRSTGVLRGRMRVDGIVLVAAASASLAAIAVNRWQFARYDLTPPIDFTAYHPDASFFELLAQGNALFGSGQLGALADWPVRYHWFAYAWAGSLDAAASSEPFTGLTRALPFVSIIAIACLAAVVASRLTRSRWVPVLASFLAVTGHFIADSSGVVVNWDSPSQTASVAILLVGSFLLLSTLGRPWTWSSAVALFAVSFTLAGYKVSSGLVFVGAAWFVLLMTYLVRSSGLRRTILRNAAIATVATALCWVVLLRGQAGSGGLAFRLWPGSAATDLSTFQGAWLTTLAVVPGWLGLVFLLSRRGSRSIPTVWFAAGLGVAGLVPLWLLQDYRPNNIWFLNAAAAPVWIVSAWGASEAVAWATKRRQLLVLLSGIVSVVASLGWGWTISRGDSPVSPQVAYLVILGVVAVVLAALVFRPLRSRFGHACVALAVMLGVLGSVTVLAAERAFVIPLTSSQTVSGGVVVDRPAETPPDGAATAPTAAATVAEIAASLRDRAAFGDEIAFLDDSLVPALSALPLRIYVAYRGYAEGLGPVGTKDEVDRRFAAIRAAESGDNETLCDDGVSWLVAPPSTRLPEPSRAVVSGLDATLWELECRP